MVEGSYFCGTECFAAAWPEHKKRHKVLARHILILPNHPLYASATNPRGNNNGTGIFNPPPKIITKRELKEEKRTEVLGAAGEGSFTAGKEVRVIEDEATVQRLMVNFDSSKIVLVLTCKRKRGRIFQGLNSMELVGVLAPEDDGGQLSIFWPPQALCLVQQGWDGEEARRRRRRHCCCCCCLAYKYI